jgi:hypothetical protein
VNLGVIETLHQLKQLVYRPAVVKVMSIGSVVDCHVRASLSHRENPFSGGVKRNDWSKPSFRKESWRPQRFKESR